MSAFEIDITNVVLFFYVDFLFCWYLKLGFFENTFWTKIPKSNHCAVSTVEAARGFPLSITVRWDMERWGCLLRLPLLKVYSSRLPTTHHNSTKKSFSSRYQYRNWSLVSVLECQNLVSVIYYQEPCRHILKLLLAASYFLSLVWISR